MQFHQCLPSDLSSINSLIEAWYGPERKYTPEQFRWTFFERNPEPSLLLSIRDHGRIVGTQAVLPISMRRGERLFLSGKSEETLLHLDYRGKGLFGKLYNQLFDRIDERIALLWGLTSARTPFEKCGFETPATAQYTIVFTGKPGPKFPLGDDPKTLTQKTKRKMFSLAHSTLRHRTRLATITGGRDTRVVEEVNLPFYESVWQQAARQLPEMVSVDRTVNWLSWRLTNHPKMEYRMLRFVDGATQGAVLFTFNSENRAAYLMDFAACGNLQQAARALINTLVFQAVREKMALIVDFGLSNNNELQQVRQKALSRFGHFLFRNDKDFMVTRKSPKEQDGVGRIEPEDWYYTFLMSSGYRY